MSEPTLADHARCVRAAADYTRIHDPESPRFRDDLLLAARAFDEAAARIAELEARQADYERLIQWFVDACADHGTAVPMESDLFYLLGDTDE